MHSKAQLQSSAADQVYSLPSLCFRSTQPWFHLHDSEHFIHLPPPPELVGCEFSSGYMYKMSWSLVILAHMELKGSPSKRLWPKSKVAAWKSTSFGMESRVERLLMKVKSYRFQVSTFMGLLNQCLRGSLILVFSMTGSFTFLLAGLVQFQHYGFVLLYFIFLHLVVIS